MEATGEKSKISVVLPVMTPTPFLRAMTEFTIRTLRLHADSLFELVVVEADGCWFDPERTKLPFVVDRYLNYTPKIGCVKEVNKGVDAATGDFLMFTGNDVIAPPHWDTELLLPFEKRKDCGVASLSAFEPGAIVGPPQALQDPEFVEGMYSPFCMVRKGWKYDESYKKIYQDSDLVLRLYAAGYRAYRSNRAHVHHLVRMTSDRVEPEKHSKEMAHDEHLFYQRWHDCPYMMYGLIRSSVITYGHEWEAWHRPITLHHDPDKVEGY